MGIITVSLPDDVEEKIRALAARKAKKKGAISETIEELVRNLEAKDKIERILDDLRQGYPINAGKIERAEIYEERA